MRIEVLYHSPSGNTALAARRIAQGFQALGGDARCSDIVSERAGLLRPDFDLLGVGFPVHAWKPTEAILAFARQLPAGEGRAAFVFCTHGGQPENVLRALAAEVEARGYRVLAGHEMPACDDWPILHAYARFMTKRGLPQPDHIRAVDAFTAHVWDLAGRGEHAAPVPFPTRRSGWDLLGRVVNAGHLRRATGVKSADPERCTRCGLCVRICPAGAIRLNPDPIFDNNCQGCWACYNLCPQRAVESSSLRGRDGHYAGPEPSVYDRTPLAL